MWRKYRKSWTEACKCFVFNVSDMTGLISNQILYEAVELFVLGDPEGERERGRDKREKERGETEGEMRGRDRQRDMQAGPARDREERQTAKEKKRKPGEC